MKDAALQCAGIIFLLNAVLHMTRAFIGAKVTVGEWIIPIWASIAISAFSFLLSAWMFMSIKDE